MSVRVRFLKDWGKSKAGQSKRVASSVVDMLVKGEIAKVETGTAEEAKAKAAADAEAAKKSNADREAGIAEKFNGGETKKQRKARKKAEAKAKAEAEAAANK